MKKFISLPIVMLLALVASESSAFTSHFHDGEAHWYVMPKIGVAPSIFVKKSTPQLIVVPAAALTPATGIGDSALYANVLQETPRLPKFSDMFHQGVLHVGIEIGRSICERSEAFLEFVYNRASGKCYGYCNPFVTLKAAEGCSADDCNSSCSSSSSSCSSSCDDGCPTGDTLSIISSLQDNYESYQAFGGYIGARHFTNRFWCDRFSFWYGYKVGMLHRKAVDSCSTIVYNTEGIQVCTGTDSVSNTLNRAVFCKSNAVSGGLQIGFDYCWSDNLSFQLGGEIVASAGLRGNRNFANDVTKVTCGTTPVALPNTALLPTNFIVSNSGTVINFPIWLGMTWEFGGCFSSCK
jgi:hypothetical protein